MNQSHTFKSYSSSIDTLLDAICELNSDRVKSGVVSNEAYNHHVFSAFTTKTSGYFFNKTINFRQDNNTGMITQISFPAQGFDEIKLGVFAYPKFYLAIKLENFVLYFDFIAKQEKYKLPT